MKQFSLPTRFFRWRSLGKWTYDMSFLFTAILTKAGHTKRPHFGCWALMELWGGEREVSSRGEKTSCLWKEMALVWTSVATHGQLILCFPACCASSSRRSPKYWMTSFQFMHETWKTFWSMVCGMLLEQFTFVAATSVLKVTFQHWPKWVTCCTLLGMSQKLPIPGNPVKVSVGCAVQGRSRMLPEAWTQSLTKTQVGSRFGRVPLDNNSLGKKRHRFCRGYLLMNVTTTHSSKQMCGTIFIWVWRNIGLQAP